MNDKLDELVISLAVIVASTVAFVAGKIDDRTWLSIIGAITFYWLGIGFGVRVRGWRTGKK